MMQFSWLYVWFTYSDKQLFQVVQTWKVMVLEVNQTYALNLYLNVYQYFLYKSVVCLQWKWKYYRGYEMDLRYDMIDIFQSTT